MSDDTPKGTHGCTCSSDKWLFPLLILFLMQLCGLVSYILSIIIKQYVYILFGMYSSNDILNFSHNTL